MNDVSEDISADCIIHVHVKLIPIGMRDHFRQVYVYVAILNFLVLQKKSDTYC